MSSLRNTLTVIRELVASDLASLLIELWKLASKVFPLSYHGMYEVLDYEAQLELLDAKGEVAVYTKREKVRFLQNNVIAYQDMAWGDGEIFADYDCEPGEEVDRYQEGHRWHVLVSLRETKNGGDIEEFNVRRQITGGFVKARESFQVEVAHKTQRLTMSVVFPKDRYPQKVLLVEQNLRRSSPLGPSNLVELPGGRLQAIWETDKPRLFEAYILQWEW